MSDPPAHKIDECSSRIYRSRAMHVKHAMIRWEATRYKLTWGDQEFAGPHVVVTDRGGDYGVHLETFFATHQPVPERPDHYVKVVKVRAICVVTTLEVITSLDGVEEMKATVPPGGYVIENPKGERYCMTREDFEQRYELDQ